MATRNVMNVNEFQESLLRVMDAKEHWAWSAFTSGLVPLARLHVHFEQEYETYVRDFPVMLGHAYVQCPIAEVRRDLAENLYEEETGAMVAGRPHPELFLEYPRGLGMDLARFECVELLPAAARYRAFLDRAAKDCGWEVATAVTTIFLEGTKNERSELDERRAKQPELPLDRHPLVVHYGLAVESLALTKAHRSVEGSHRAAAWRMVLGWIAPERRRAVVDAMQEALARWEDYRDDVASACGLEPVRQTTSELAVSLLSDQ